MSPLKVYSIDSNSPKCRIKWSCDGSSDENKSMYHGGALLHIILCPDSTVIATLSHFSALFLDVTQVRLAVAETLLMMLPCLLATFYVTPSSEYPLAVRGSLACMGKPGRRVRNCTRSQVSEDFRKESLFEKKR